MQGSDEKQSSAEFSLDFGTYMVLLGNAFVIFWRIRFPSSGITYIIITNLAVVDLIMGFYMIVIASVDAYYKGVFIEYTDQWKESWMCSLAGILATFSSEGSVLFLCLLTVDRFTNIMFPFGKKLTKDSVYILLPLFGLFLSPSALYQFYLLNILEKTFMVALLFAWPYLLPMSILQAGSIPLQFLLCSTL